ACFRPPPRTATPGAGGRCGSPRRARFPGPVRGPEAAPRAPGCGARSRRGCRTEYASGGAYELVDPRQELVLARRLDHVVDRALAHAPGPVGLLALGAVYQDSDLDCSRVAGTCADGLA